jgi:aryl-alcohol dehydrogenase-like predicted oxidoreductase
MSSETTAAAAGTITIGGDLVVNRLGFGAMRITGSGIWGPPPDHDEAIATVRRAVELGVNFIDTADSYGPDVSEELLAEALHPYPADLVIATKAGLVRPGPNRWEADGRPEHIRSACEGSLRRLRVDQIAVYQFHRPDPKVPLADSIGTFVELQNEGKVRHIGVSNVSVAQLAEAQELTTIVSVQNRFNADDRSSDAVLSACEGSGLAFLPWAPIQQSEVLETIAARHQVPSRQLALAWMLARSPQLLPIPGTGSVSHLESNIAAAALALSPEEVDEITSASAA